MKDRNYEHRPVVALSTTGKLRAAPPRPGRTQSIEVLPDAVPTPRVVPTPRIVALGPGATGEAEPAGENLPAPAPEATLDAGYPAAPRQNVIARALKSLLRR